MKYKKCFVTNSSSTSFIVKGKTGEILKEMWDLYLKDFKCYFDEKNINEAQFKANEWVNKNYKTFNENVIIPWTCNYETLIFHNPKLEKELVEVNTCNNINWRDSSLDIINIKNDYTDEISLSDIEFLDLSDMKVKKFSKYIEDELSSYKTSENG